MRAILVGGPLEGTSIQVTPAQSETYALAEDGTVHRYCERFGRTFTNGPAGTRLDESALYFHEAACHMSVASALEYCERKGL